MRYFFILGTNPVLSTAEIIALLPGSEFTVREMYKQALVVESATGAVLDTKDMMRRLGGTIKIGTIHQEDVPVDAEKLEALILEKLSGRVAEFGNATFGISIYSLESTKPSNRAAAVGGKFRNVGMSVKKKLKLAGCAARWVKAQQGTALSSVVVTKDKLLVDGAEFVVLTKDETMMFGTTDVVQPFEEFSQVDYGRPERDLVQGMLPPKLARIMINLIHVSKEVKDVALLDPFCGSGTILTEALQMGFRELFGSDKNQEAVYGTQKNIDWIKEKGFVKADPPSHIALFASDARNLRQHIKLQSIDAVVTEPYLGPPLRGGEKRGELQKTLGELTKLYYESLSAWRTLLKPNAPVIMAMPVYIHGAERHGINCDDFANLGFKTEPLLPSIILGRLGVKETRNHGLMYGRLDQHVWREIVRLRLSE